MLYMYVHVVYECVMSMLNMFADLHLLPTLEQKYSDVLINVYVQVLLGSVNLIIINYSCFLSCTLSDCLFL